MKQFLLLNIVAIFLSGCGAVLGPTAAEMTLQSQNQSLSTQIADLRMTATVEADRMMITAEHAATEVRAVALQRDALRATLIARGTDAGFVDVTIPNAGDLPEGISPESLLPEGSNPVAAPPITPGAGDVLAPAIGTPTLAATPPPSGGPQLQAPTLTSGVNDSDCAIDNMNTFSDTASSIYIAAVALNFPAGTTITARWSREGTVMGSYDIPFNFEIENACIWAFIDQTDFAFTPGNWTVELLINGTPAAGPIPFTIVGSGGDAAGEAMMEEGS